jgi:beta-lactamase regulating signal transducer with metallopeptidase domain
MNYELLLQELKDKYFPELKKIKITIKPLRILKKTFMITLPFSKKIYYNKTVIEKCNEKALKAVLLHELYHIKQFERLGVFKKIFFVPLYHLDNDLRIKHELEAHIGVVKRGFGEELLELNKFVMSRYPKNVWEKKLLHYYLSERQIKEIMDNVKKT